jgi:hypothetical protein
MAKYMWFGHQRMTGYGSQHPSPPYIKRGATGDGDKQVLGPNKLVSMLGE